MVLCYSEDIWGALEVTTQSSWTRFTLPIPWKEFMPPDAECIPRDSVCMPFLNFLKDSLCFFPRGKTLSACQNMRFDIFHKVYPFVYDDRPEQMKRIKSTTPSEKDGFCAISLRYCGKRMCYSLVVHIDTAKAFSLFSRESASGFTNSLQKIMCIHQYNTIKSILTKTCCVSLRKSPTFRRGAMAMLTRCFVEAYFSAKEYAVFSGYAFGVAHLIYKIACRNTPRLMQHSAYGVIVDVDWECVLSPEEMHVGHYHSTWQDVVRSSRVLHAWRKKLRWIHVHIKCVSMKGGGSFQEELPKPSIVFETSSETFCVYGTVIRDVCFKSEIM